LPWEAKTATVAKLRGLFCSFFFLRGRNFEKVRGLKLQLSLYIKFLKKIKKIWVVVMNVGI